MDPVVLKTDFLVLSFSISIVSLIYGGYKVLKAIHSLRSEYKSIQEDKRLATDIQMDTIGIGIYFFLYFIQSYVYQVL